MSDCRRERERGGGVGGEKERKREGTGIERGKENKK